MRDASITALCKSTTCIMIGTERQGKEAHLLQNTSSEAQHVERGEDVPDGTIEFVANERGGIVEVFVIFDSKQHKE